MFFFWIFKIIYTFALFQLETSNYMFNFYCNSMDTLTKLKAEKDISSLYEARLILYRYIIEHQRMLRYKDSCDVTENLRCLKRLRPAYKQLDKIVRFFEREYRRNLTE